ncbi:MAG: class I SAM-dependent methyltransferase [Burkholderiaceae bacterium]|nr:class I SAM-dependent methyltransferase [Burkholderiaceae bacterium]
MVRDPPGQRHAAMAERRAAPTLNAFVQNVISALAQRAGVAFAVVLPDRTRQAAGGADARFTVLIHTDAALLALATRAHYGLGQPFYRLWLDDPLLIEMERCGLEVVDIENLRRHYAPTLDAWAERFDRRWGEIQALDPQRFDERFRRVWRSYLVGCAEMFRSPAGYTHLFQIVFSKGLVTRDNYPMSRAHLYGAGPAT